MSAYMPLICWTFILLRPCLALKTCDGRQCKFSSACHKTSSWHHFGMVQGEQLDFDAKGTNPALTLLYKKRRNLQESMQARRFVFNWKWTELETTRLAPETQACNIVMRKRYCKNAGSPREDLGSSLQVDEWLQLEMGTNCQEWPKWSCHMESQQPWLLSKALYSFSCHPLTVPSCRISGCAIPPCMRITSNSLQTVVITCARQYLSCWHAKIM